MNNQKDITKNIPEFLVNWISGVWFSDHRMENTFVHYSLSKTLNEMEHLGFSPKGICVEPGYSPSSGIAFVFEDDDYNTGWVHVPFSIFYEWLGEYNLMPPVATVWDWITVKAHYKEKCLEVNDK